MSQFRNTVSRAGALALALVPTIPFILTLLIAGCGSEEVRDVNTVSDVESQINQLQTDENAAIKAQVDVLSPNNFKEAQECLSTAKVAEKSNEFKEASAQITNGRNFLNKAQEKAQLAGLTLPFVIAARHDALKADAAKNFAQELAKLDEELLDVTRDIEDNSTKSAERNRDKLQAKYLELELLAIKFRTLNDAKLVFQKAAQEGAQKSAIRTYTGVEKKFTEADQFINGNRHNTAELQKLSQNMLAEANHLLKITRDVTLTNKKDPEELALELEAQQNGRAALENQLQTKQTEIQGTQEELNKKNTAVSTLQTTLQSERDFNQKFEAVRAQFSPDEADIFKDGSRLILRLKGLTFTSGQSEIGSSNYPLLARVQKVIRDFGNSTVTIEGHTDSAEVKSKFASEKLSTQRARAIQSYFIANEIIDQNRTSVIGVGEEKPIASNKTKAGRALNRRIDLVIAPERDQAVGYTNGKKKLPSH